MFFKRKKWKVLESKKITKSARVPPPRDNHCKHFTIFALFHTWFLLVSMLLRTYCVKNVVPCFPHLTLFITQFYKFVYEYVIPFLLEI